MEEIIELNNGYTLRITQDEYGESPREWNEFSEMLCNHGRYNLGDTHLECHGTSFEDDFKKHITDEGLMMRDVIVLPLYLYDHSGITMSTSPFSCSWDSGQVGYIYTTRAKVRDEYMVKRVTKKLEEEVLERLKGEVETYDMYITGEVYGYVIEDEEGDTVDSCSGFYGFDYCKGEAESIAKSYEAKVA